MPLADRSLARPVTVLVVTAAVLVIGAVSIARLPLDFLPNMEFPFLGVLLPYPNSVPSQTERDLARPVEEVLATLGDVREVFSETDQDGAFVGVTFEFGRPVDILRLEVKEKMEQVRPLLPRDLEDYLVLTFNSNDIPIMVGRISARDWDLAGSYDLLEQRIVNPLRRIDGVGQVEVGGISPQEITVYLLLDRLIEYSVDAGRLFELLNANNVDLSVGRVMHGKQRLTVRALGQFRSIEDIGELRVTPSGVRLKDVAEIVLGEPEPSYFRRLNGEPAVAFSIQKASGANTVDVSRRVHRVLEEIQRDPALRGIDVVLFFDQAEEIRSSLVGLLESGMLGSVLAVGILLFFFRRFRSTLIASLAIPVSVIGTAVFLYLTHRSLNVLTMCGLMLAVGMLVDNAIVVLEAIHQRRPARPSGVLRTWRWP
jgi:HAE1 family hydrophobic/amphiphilic exporter-1